MRCVGGLVNSFRESLRFSGILAKVVDLKELIHSLVMLY